MKNIITLALLGLAVTACDPFNDEPGGTPTVKYVTVTGSGYGPFEGSEGATAWTVDAQTSTATSGRMIVITTNQLLDGASIEAAPYELNGATGCVPTGASNADNTNGWLTVTSVPGALGVTGPLPTGGAWYTCYYPSSATASDGASVVLYYSAVPPGISTAARPTVSAVAPASDLQYRGTIKTKGGADLPVNVNASFGFVQVTPVPVAPATRLTVAPAGTIALGQNNQNRDPAASAWTITSCIDDTGAAAASTAVCGALSAATGATPTFTAAAALPAGATFVQAVVRARNKNVDGTRTIRVIAP